MPHRVISSIEQLQRLTTLLSGLKLPITVEWVQGKDRTKDQNATMWMWASEAGQQTGEAPADVQARWKLTIGVPILRRDSAEFRAAYDDIIKPLSYQAKAAAMRDLGFAVTSTMKVRQMVEFLDTVQRECLQNGIELTEPDPELADYQKRYRTGDSHD